MSGGGEGPGNWRVPEVDGVGNERKRKGNGGEKAEEPRGVGRRETSGGEEDEVDGWRKKGRERVGGEGGTGTGSGVAQEDEGTSTSASVAATTTAAAPIWRKRRVCRKSPRK